MSVTFDGDRAKKRLWFAKKLIRVLKMLGILSKTAKLNGFLFKVWNVGGLFGGRITSPMGAVVLYSTGLGVQVCIADNWSGGFTNRTYLSVLFKNLSSGLTTAMINRTPEDQMITDGYLTIPSTAVIKDSFYYFQYPFPPTTGDDTVGLEDAPPSPVLMPFLNDESFWIHNSSFLYVDVNADGSQDFPYWRSVSESSLSFYSSDGSGLNKRLEAFTEGAASSNIILGTRIIALLPSENVNAVQMSLHNNYPESGGVKYAALNYLIDKDNILHRYFNISTVLQHIPSGLLTAINHEDSTAKIMGNYAFSDTYEGDPIFLHALNLTEGYLYADSSEDEWFDDYGSEQWRLSFHIYDVNAGTVASFNISDFIGVLQGMYPGVVDGIGDVQYIEAHYTFVQLFGRPNSSSTVPHDTVMFHTEFGDIRTWTRKYGMFKFSTSGLSAVDPGNYTIPTLADTTDGIRPTITYAGDGMYLCVSEFLGSPYNEGPILDPYPTPIPGKPSRIHEIHTGSPFIAWDSLPTPTGTDNLVHVRPVRVKVDDVILLGVIESEEGLYYIAFLKYKDNIGEWERMGEIPATKPTSDYPDNSSWDIALFGNGEYVKEMSKYMSPPVAMMQMPVGPYAGYAGGMP